MVIKARKRHEEYQQYFTENDLLHVEFDHIGPSVSKFWCSIWHAFKVSGSRSFDMIQHTALRIWISAIQMERRKHAS